MKIGDKLNFKKFQWIIVSKKKTIFGGTIYKYRVIRKYYKFMKLSYTNQSYTVCPGRWNFLKKMLGQNKNYNYNMSLWSNQPR